MISIPGMVNMLMYPTAETCAMGSGFSSNIQHFNFSSMTSYNYENACLSYNSGSYKSIQYLCLGECVNESMIIDNSSY